MKSAADILKEAEALARKDDLSDYLEVIAVLRAKRSTWREIADFLTERGIKADHAKVYRFALANEEKISRLANKQVNMSKSNQADIPTAKEYVDALSAIKISDAQKKMLGAHFLAHNRSITYTELANAAGYDSHAAANLQYGKLGKVLGEKLEFRFLKAPARDSFFYSSAIGMDNPNIPVEDEEYQLIMHHELAKALAKLRWFKE
jgi:hypothetical protein